MTVLILTGICVLSLLLNYQSATASEVLPVSIQANKMADYSADAVSVPNPVVNMEIIEAVIKDQEPTNVVERLENVLTNLQTAVPTVTPTPVSTDTPVPVGGEPELSQVTQTNPPPPTATTRPPEKTNTLPPYTATASKTALSTENGATATKTGTSAPTEVPTNTPKKTSTATEVPESTPTSTKPPAATNTATKTPFSPPPTATKTPTTPPPKPTDTATKLPPTATNTKVPPTATYTATKVPPTATYTATKVPPTATDTVKPTATYTAKPTATMTPTVWCSWPNRWTGFVEYTDPKNDAQNVPRNVTVVIQFNQPMYQGDLFSNIKVSGTKVDHVMSYDPLTYRVTIDFQGLLEPGSRIEIEVKRNIKNICRWRQLIVYDFHFHVVGD